MNEAEREARFQAYLHLVRQRVLENGFIIQGVFPTEHAPMPAPFAYTIGLCDAGLPELIVSAPASPEMLHLVLTVFAHRHVKDEIKHSDEISYTDLGMDVPTLGEDQRFRAMLSVSAPVQQAYNYAGDPENETGKVRVLQLLWPDEQGRFPGDPGYQDDGDQVVWP